MSLKAGTIGVTISSHYQLLTTAYPGRWTNTDMMLTEETCVHETQDWLTMTVSVEAVIHTVSESRNYQFRIRNIYGAIRTNPNQLFYCFLVL